MNWQPSLQSYVHVKTWRSTLSSTLPQQRYSPLSSSAPRTRTTHSSPHALHVLRTDKAYLNAGYDSFQEYVENKLRFSVAKANNLATRWEHFVAPGLSTNVLTGPNPVSWGKFAELIPGVKAGVIDDQSIDVWLPLTRTDGHLSLNNTGIAKFVKAEIAALDQEEDPPDQPKDFTIKVTADDRANILQYIDTIEQGTGMLGAGEVVRAALEAKVTDIAFNSEDIRRTFGIVKLIEMAQNMAPGIQLTAIASADSGYNPENLGVVPYTSLYQNGDEPGSVVLATSAEEAAQALGSDNIVESTVRGWCSPGGCGRTAALKESSRSGRNSTTARDIIVGGPSGPPLHF